MNDFDFSDDTIEDQTSRDESVIDTCLERFYSEFGRIGLYHRGERFQARLRELLRHAYFGGFCEGRRSAIGEVIVEEPTRKWRVAG